jgi:glycosyltransferase 2 family protein
VPPPGHSGRGRVWSFRVLQALILIGAAYYVVSIAAAHWPAIRSRDLAWRAGPLALSGLLVLLTLAVLLAAWTTSLRWCAARVRYLDAARIWFTANLARFIPGTVWQFASLAAMSSRYGVAPLAATATVLLEQVVLLITGLLVLAALTPAVLHAAWWQTALAVAAGLGVVGLALPRPGGRLGRWLETQVPGVRLLWSGVTPVRLALFALTLVTPWLLYGVAFRLLAVGLLGAAPPAGSWGFYMAAFTGSYVAGVIAVFAPAGLLVREAALIGVLSPVLGSSDAVILAGAARIWLTALEFLGAAIVLALPTTETP